MTTTERTGNESRSGSSVAASASVITGFRYAARNIGYLRNRLSFPLLRQNISTIYKRTKEPAESHISNFTDKQLRRSINGHIFLLISFGLIFIYSVLMTAKGLAALIRFDALTMWLVYGPIIFFIACVYLFISTSSIRYQKNELSRRAKK